MKFNQNVSESDAVNPELLLRHIELYIAQLQRIETELGIFRRDFFNQPVKSLPASLHVLMKLLIDYRLESSADYAMEKTCPPTRGVDRKLVFKACS